MPRAKQVASHVSQRCSVSERVVLWIIRTAEDHKRGKGSCAMASPGHIWYRQSRPAGQLGKLCTA